MKATERKAASCAKLLEKLEIQREKRAQILEKKRAIALLYGVDIDFGKWCEIRTTATPEQHEAYLSLCVARDDFEETERRIIRLKEKSGKAEKAVAQIREAIAAEETERQKSEEISRWAEDGIKVVHMTGNIISGLTPSGVRFCINGNNGITERSLHCFSLTIDNELVFTSGEFYRAYKIIKGR